MENLEHYHIYYLSKKKYITNSQRKLKFIIFLPNINEAESFFPKAPLPLFVYDINIWVLVDDIGEGRVFPVKTPS